MKHVSDERGYTFVYVLMIFAILLIVAPVLVNIASSEQLLDRKDGQSQRIEQLALSGMESFIDYLGAYPGGSIDKLTYFNDYPAWGKKELRLPEGGIMEMEMFAFYIEDGVRKPYPQSEQPPHFVPPVSKNAGVRMSVAMKGTDLSSYVDYGITVGSDPVNDNPLISEVPIYPGTDGVVSPSELPQVPGKTPEEVYDLFFDQLIPATFDYTVTDFCGWEAAMQDAIGKNKTQATIKVTGSQTIEPDACAGGSWKGTYDYTGGPGTIFVVYINTAANIDYSQSNGQIVYMNGMLLVDGNVRLANKSDLHIDDLIVREGLDIVNKTEITGDNIAAKQYDPGTDTVVNLDPAPNPNYNYPTDTSGGETGGGGTGGGGTGGSGGIGGIGSWNPVRL